MHNVKKNEDEAKKGGGCYAVGKRHGDLGGQQLV